MYPAKESLKNQTNRKRIQPVASGNANNAYTRVNRWMTKSLNTGHSEEPPRNDWKLYALSQGLVTRTRRRYSRDQHIADDRSMAKKIHNNYLKEGIVSSEIKDVEILIDRNYKTKHHTELFQNFQKGTWKDFTRTNIEFLEPASSTRITVNVKLTQCYIHAGLLMVSER